MRKKLYSFLAMFSLLFLMNEAVAQTSLTSENRRLPDWAFGGFVRPAGVNPIISPRGDSRFADPMSRKMLAWENNDTFNPAAVVKDGKIVVLYRAEDKSGAGIGERTSRIGYAESSDGLRFTRYDKPVLFPSNDDQKTYEWPGGCEDPRVSVTEDGTYIMFYTQWNRKIPRLGMAESKDLKTWTKYGPIFRKAYEGKFLDMPHKSASIVTKVVNGKQVIAKVNGKYWMYWGDYHVYAATSDNLIDWKPLVDKKGKLKILIPTRKGYFDSQITECGPPAVITDKGILLIYNGQNLPGDDGDRRFAPGAYCAGQVLFDKDHPDKAIARLKDPFFVPREPYEKTGQYKGGTTFIEGLVYFKGKWFAYYGCADSYVSVAVYNPAHPAPPDPLD